MVSIDTLSFRRGEQVDRLFILHGRDRLGKVAYRRRAVLLVEISDDLPTARVAQYLEDRILGQLLPISLGSISLQTELQILERVDFL